MNKLILLAVFLFSTSAWSAPKKVIVQTTDGYAIWTVEGYLPKGYLCDAPVEAETIADVDLNVSKKIAVLNRAKMAARIKAEADAKAKVISDHQKEMADLKPIADKVEAGMKLSDEELQTFLLALKKRAGL